MNNKATALITTIFVVALAAVLVFCFVFGIHSGDETSEATPDTSGVSFDTSASIDQSTAASTDDTVPDPSSEPEVSEEVSEEPEDTVVHFLACPDNIIHTSVYYDALEIAARKDGVKPDYSLFNAKFDFSELYKNVAPEIQAADIAFINMETLIGGDKYGVSGYPSFNSPEALGEELIKIGFDVFNLCHNHMLDSYNDTYLKGCYNYFSSLGMTTIGYIKDEDAIDDIVVYECKGIKIAMLPYTYCVNDIRLPDTTVIPLLENEELIRRQVKKAKEVADVVIVFPHWGNENTYNVSSYEWPRQYTAELFAELEVDMVIGMHPHVIQKMEYLTCPSGKKMLVAYSLGNFTSGMHDAFNYVGGMLAFDIVKDAITGEITFQNILFEPVTTHSTAEKAQDSNDTGYRNMSIWYIEDYTEELASQHHCVTREKKTGEYSLIGPDGVINSKGRGTGRFTKDNLVRTVKAIIPEEFLSDYYKNYVYSD